MKKTIAILTLLITFTMANSENRTYLPEATALQELLKHQGLITNLRVIRESRETRETREISTNEARSESEKRLERDVRENREERLTYTARREDRKVRYVKVKERKYIVTLK